MGSHGTKHESGGCSCGSDPEQGDLSPERLCPRLVHPTNLVTYRSKSGSSHRAMLSKEGHGVWKGGSDSAESNLETSFVILAGISKFFWFYLLLNSCCPSPGLVLNTHTRTQEDSASHVRQTLTSAQLQSATTLLPMDLWHLLCVLPGT